MRFYVFIVMMLFFSAAGKLQAANDSSLVGLCKVESYCFKLKSSARVKGNLIELSEVIELGVNKNKMSDKLLSLPVGRVPRNKYGSYVLLKNVKAAVERAFPGVYANAVWIGVDKIKINTIKRKIDSYKYLNMASEHVVDKISSEGTTGLSVAVTGKYKDIQVPEGDILLSPQSMADSFLTKRMCVWIDIFVDGEHYRSLPVWFVVEANREVLAAKFDVNTTDYLTAKQFDLKVLDVTDLSSRPVTLNDLHGNWRVKRKLKSGEILTKDLLEIAPDVFKGQKVKVRAKVGNVSLETVATAMEDGSVGSRVRVNKPDTDIMYSTKVVDLGVVLVDVSN